MRSFGRPSTKLEATFFKASMRFGFKSLANILPETSIAITISTPLVDLVWLLISTFLGRAMAMISELKANNRNTNRYSFNLAAMDFSALNPLTELILSVAADFFPFQKTHATATGSNKNNQKNSGFKKLTSFIILLLLVLPNSTYVRLFSWRIGLLRV